MTSEYGKCPKPGYLIDYNRLDNAQLLTTNKPPYGPCNIFGRICWQKCRQFQLYLAARRIRITHFNLIIISEFQLHVGEGEEGFQILSSNSSKLHSQT